MPAIRKDSRFFVESDIDTYLGTEMKIKIQQFLFNKNHSWAIVGQNIGRALLKKGHDVHFISTDGVQEKFIPPDLKSYIREKPQGTYDAQISYTAMKNFPAFLKNGNKNRIGIWNFETTILPPGFAKYYKFTDKFCPSSKFAAKIFSDNGVPENHIEVVPHGINVEEYRSFERYPLKTQKRYKILANIAQPHVRKNIDGLFESYGMAFNKNDDVCLVAKVSAKKIPSPQVIKARTSRGIRKQQQKQSEKKDKISQFDVDFYSIYNAFCNKYPNHAEVEIINEFVPSMVPIYNVCDIVYSVTHAECFWLPGLEGMATNNLIIAPNWGGQLEYMNEGNSLLIDGKEGRAPKKMQYWVPSPYAATFIPDLDDAAAKLQQGVREYDTLMTKFRPGMNEQLTRLTWNNVSQMILDLME